MKKVINLSICLLILSSLPAWNRSNPDTRTGTTSKFETRGPQEGTLLIIGGGASDIFYIKFMELVGGPDASIVVIPTAITSDELCQEDLERFRNSFVQKGFNHVTVLHIRDREEANSNGFIAPIQNAAGVWFSGGRQWRHADSYLDTKTHRAFFELQDRGGIIAGSSAGATIQGSYLARGDSKANTILMGDHLPAISTKQAILDV